jgi:hypothetical protein
MKSSLNTNHSDPQICRQCRGQCCQGHPGVWVDPERFLRCFDIRRPDSPDTLCSRLAPLGLTLRYIDGVPIPSPQQNEQGCRFLGSDGCRFTEQKRPCQCLALTPVLETLLDDQIHCILPPDGSTATALKNWRGFWQIT